MFAQGAFEDATARVRGNRQSGENTFGGKGCAHGEKECVDEAASDFPLASACKSWSMISRGTVSTVPWRAFFGNEVRSLRSSQCRKSRETTTPYLFSSCLSKYTRHSSPTLIAEGPSAQ